MNYPRMIGRMFGARHRPRRSKSRWRKTLERKYRPHEILSANRLSPLMDVRFHPRSEEERARIEEVVMTSLGVMGTVAVVPLLAEAMAKVEGKE